MRINLFTLLITLFSTVVHGQSYFEVFNKNKESISFESSANLVIIPAIVNGTEMNFIVDTGSAKTVIFDLNKIDSLNIKKGRVLKYKGLGSNDYFEAYYSPNNKIQIGNNIINKNAEILIMVNKDFSVTERLGVNVNGIIGADLFQNLIIDINYEKKRLTAYSPSSKTPRYIRKARYIPIEFNSRKPYVSSVITNDKSLFQTKLLIDTGSSDALLVHGIDSTQFNYPKNNFRDYLGYGLSGELYGNRSKIDLLQFSNFDIKKSTVSFIEKGDMEKSSLYTKSNGSIGGEILRRFNIIFNYGKGKVSFVPNQSIREGFYYNMAGIQLKLEGTDLIVSRSDGRYTSAKDNYKEYEGQVTLQNATLTYKSIPKIIVANVNENSAAFNAGLRKGDQIIKINGKTGENLTLNKASSFFFKNPYSDLKITYRRDGDDKEISIPLIPIIE